MRTITFMLSTLFLAGCASHRFVPTGIEQANVAPKSPGCGAKVLLHLPTDNAYTELGLCMAQVPGGGMISDKTPEAIAQLQDCACEAGGDAVILSKAGESGVIPAFGGYSQQVAKVTGIVIMFKE